MQRKWREEKQPAGAHGVLAIVDDHHAKTLFNVENFQTLVPVMVAHGVGKKPAEWRHRIIQCDQLKMFGIPGRCHVQYI